MNDGAERPAPDDRLRAARAWSWEDLSDVWQQLRRRQHMEGWPQGIVFEHLVLRGLELDGYQIGWPCSVSLPEAAGIAEQIDGVAFDGPRGLLVECKDLSEPAAVEALAKFRLRLERRPPGTMGLLFSTGGFTPATVMFARWSSPLNILLWDGDDVDHAIQERCFREPLERKWRYAVAYGNPMFGVGVPRDGDERRERSRQKTQRPAPAQQAAGRPQAAACLLL